MLCGCVFNFVREILETNLDHTLYIASQFTDTHIFEFELYRKKSYFMAKTSFSWYQKNVIIILLNFITMCRNDIPISQ